MSESIDSTIVVSGAGSEKPNGRDVHVLVKVSGADEEYHCHLPEGDLKYVKFGGAFKDYTTIKIDIVDTADGSVKETITYTDTTCDEPETTRQLEDIAVGSSERANDCSGVQELTDGELRFDATRDIIGWTLLDHSFQRRNWKVMYDGNEYFVHIAVTGHLVLGTVEPLAGLDSGLFTVEPITRSGNYVIRSSALSGHLLVVDMAQNQLTWQRDLEITRPQYAGEWMLYTSSYNPITLSLNLMQIQVESLVDGVLRLTMSGSPCTAMFPLAPPPTP